MSCRSTKYLSWACAIHRFVCTTGHSCHVGLQSVHHGLVRSTLQLKDQAMYAVKVNKVSVMDLRASTFNS